MTRRITALVAVVASLMLALTACTGTAPAGGEASSAQESGTTDKASQLYIEVSALGNLAYFYDHKMGMEAVGKDLGVKTEYVGPAEYDMNAMIAAFEEAIAKKPNGIVVVGFEDTLTPIIKKATDAGIPVVTVDADLPESTRVAFVGTGNFNAGVQGGKTLAEAIGGKGKVALMTKPGQSNLEERIAGYNEALAAYPDIQIVQVADTRSDPVVAAQAAAALLQKYPDLAGIGCVEAAGGAGAATAAKEANVAGTLKIVSMDRDNDVVNSIEEGTITASVAQQTALMPYYAVQILYNLSNSDVAITTDNAKAGVSGIPSTVDTGVIIVSKDNAQYFKR